MALVIEEHLNKLTQITSHWVDPDDHPDVEPNGLVMCPSDNPSTVDVSIIAKNENYVEAPEWWPAAQAAMDATEEQIQNDKAFEMESESGVMTDLCLLSHRKLRRSGAMSPRMPDLTSTR